MQVLSSQSNPGASVKDVIPYGTPHFCMGLFDDIGSDNWLSDYFNRV